MRLHFSFLAKRNGKPLLILHIPSKAVSQSAQQRWNDGWWLSCDLRKMCLPGCYWIERNWVGKARREQEEFTNPEDKPEAIVSDAAYRKKSAGSVRSVHSVQLYRCHLFLFGGVLSRR